VVCVLLWLIPTLLDRPPEPITWTYGSSTQHVDVLWLKQSFLALPTANDNGVIFAMSLRRDSLFAIDIKTGAILWKIDLPFEHWGDRGLLADQNTVFVITTDGVDTYDAKTGQLKWTTKLGYGHVTIMSQLESNVLRVYYGDKIYELDLESGKILRTRTKGETTWIFGNTALVGFNAFDMQTRKLLWNEGPAFYLDEGKEPKELGTNILLVTAEPGGDFSRGICALNMQTGKYSWCRTEEFNSMIAIDNHSGLGYAMRDDFVLLTINLETGNILGETSFLSSRPIDKETGSLASVTASSGVVVVTFFDSGQTFALQLK
jgi:outer membrane protein assembly factor BamB